MPSTLHFTRVFLVAVAALGLAVVGCTQVQVAPDARGEYKFGELQVFVDRDFAQSHSAAKQALKDLALFETRDDRKVIEAELNARDTADTLVIVKLKEVGPRRTSVKIRYGVLKPDLVAAQKLFGALEKHL